MTDSTPTPYATDERDPETLQRISEPCPKCGSEGWPSTRWFAAYSAHCGTAWGDDGYSSQSEPCHTIESLRFELTATALLGGTAA